MSISRGRCIRGGGTSECVSRSDRAHAWFARQPVDFTTDTNRAVTQLHYTGRLARTPNVKYIFSHAGGSIPYLAARFEIVDKMGFIPGGGQRSTADDMFRRVYWAVPSGRMFPGKDGSMRIAILAALKQRGSRKRTISAKAVLTICTVLIGSVAATPMAAQVQLPSVNLGDTNFEDGFAGPGFLLEEFPDVYIANTLRDNNGADVSGSNTLTAISTTSHVAYISNKRFFGAWVGAEFLVPMVDVQVKLASGTNATVRGFADPILGPFALQWAPKKIGHGVFVHRALLDLTVPIGKYSDQRPVNIGNNLVTINPYYALTYEWKSRMEASARFHYLWNSTNKSPFVGFGIKNMQPGQAFHANYATSYEVMKGVRVGFNGYWLQQLTDHQIDDEDVPNSKERTVGLGPGVQFGGDGLWFRVNSYIETEVRNRPAGTRVTFRVSKALPIRRHDP